MLSGVFRRDRHNPSPSFMHRESPSGVQALGLPGSRILLEGARMQGRQNRGA
jgi:hypothetical protein